MSPSALALCVVICLATGSHTEQSGKGKDVSQALDVAEFVEFFRHLEAKINNLETSNAALQKSNTDLQKSNTDLQKSNTEVKLKVHNLEISNAALKKSNTDFQKSNADLQKSSADLQKSNAALQKSNVALQKSNPDLQKANAEVKLKVHKLETSNAALQKSNTDFQKTRADLHKYNADLQKSNADLQKSSADLQKSFADVKVEVNNLETSIANKTKVDSQVMFTAYRSYNFLVYNTQVFVFDQQITNIGGGYNRRTGVFTAPVAGLYTFHVHVTGLTGRQIQVCIRHNNNYVAKALAVAMIGPQSASTSADLKLRKGDTVKVTSEGTSYNYAYIASSFSGHLV